MTLLLYQLRACGDNRPLQINDSVGAPPSPEFDVYHAKYRILAITCALIRIEMKAATLYILMRQKRYLRTWF
jgi:hypothetical protein